jgi:hypothetical protein
MVTLPLACVLISPKSKGARNLHFANEEHGASDVMTLPRTCAFTSPESTAKVQGLRFIEGGHGASHMVTSPRTCVSELCDIVMPIHGSRDVLHDDDPRNAALFINQTLHDVSCGTFYESGREGSDACVVDQSLRSPEIEETTTVGKTLGSRREEYTARLSFWSSIPPFPFSAAVCVSARRPSLPSHHANHLSVVDAMADRRESRTPKCRPLGSEPTTRSNNRAASAARQILALGQTNLGKAAPPVVATAQVPPVPRRTADTPETAFRQNLARSAGASSAENELVITGPPEEGGHVMAAIRVSPTGHPIARAPSATDAAHGVQDSNAQAAQRPTSVFAPATDG